MRSAIQIHPDLSQFYHVKLNSIKDVDGCAAAAIDCWAEDVVGSKVFNVNVMLQHRLTEGSGANAAVPVLRGGNLS